jgi:probable HAF family extracellular repeat protein
MKRLLTIASTTLLFLAGSAIIFQAQQGPIHGCYQKNSGQPRIVQSSSECTPGELAVAWAGARSNAAKKAGTKTITALQTLGGTQNQAYAINDRGEIVGQSRVAGDASTHAFLYRQGQVFDLSPVNSGNIVTGGPTGINNAGQIASGFIVGGVYVPVIFNSLAQTATTLGSLGGVNAGGLSGVATAINNGDVAVGYAYLNALNRHAFVYREGVLSDIGSFGGYSAALDINDPGTIVGFASNAVNGIAHAFLYRDGAMTDIDPFGGGNFATSESYANSINNGGDVVGEGLIQAGTAFHAFLNRRGAVTDLGTLPGGRSSFAKAINESGVIVGNADVPFVDTCFDFLTRQFVPCINYKLSAFVYANGVMTDLNSLIPDGSGWELVYASDINNRGQIVGYGLLNGKLRAFELH